ncbi:MAG: DUF2752 domain-containing protein [Clostridiales bacterium]|nr:DUF2752 domain-containing protein [Clostridiales bacterium]
MKKKSTPFKIFVILLPVISIPTIFFTVNLYEKYIYSIHFPCLFNVLTGYLCPGCGNTRSIIELLNGNILLSLKYNPFIIISFIFLILLYIEIFTSTFFVHKKIIPRSNKFLFIALGIMIFYYFIRNFIPVLIIPGFY